MILRGSLTLLGALERKIPYWGLWMRRAGSLWHKKACNSSRSGWISLLSQLCNVELLAPDISLGNCQLWINSTFIHWEFVLQSRNRLEHQIVQLKDFVNPTWLVASRDWKCNTETAVCPPPPSPLLHLTLAGDRVDNLEQFIAASVQCCYLSIKIF